MLQVCHAQWISQLPGGENSEGYSIITELREKLRPLPLRRTA
jgi:hypothetical protein